MKAFDRFVTALVIACVLFVAIVLAASFANAATPSDIVHAACSSTGQELAIWALGVIGVGSLISWSKNVMKTLPQPVQHVINFVALNWPQIARDLGVLK